MVVVAVNRIGNGGSKIYEKSTFLQQAVEEIQFISLIKRGDSDGRGDDSHFSR